jgi:signal transduction histidine kinase
MAETYIIVVDDEELIRKQTEAALRRAGYRIATAWDGASALALIKQQVPDLLIADIRMPDMDGLQLFSSARKLFPDLAALLMTAHGTIETAIHALQLGVQGFLQKPFTAGELERAVQEALEKIRMARESVRLRVLSPLLEARKMLVSDFDLTSFCRNLVELTARETISDYCAIYLPDNTGGTMEPEAVFTSPRAARIFSPRIFPAHRLATRSLELNRTLSLKRSSNPEKQVSENDVPGLVIAIPMVYGGKSVGALLVGRTQIEYPFSASERELFEILAAQLATLVENRRLYQVLSEREERLRLFLGKFVLIQEEERQALSHNMLEKLLPLVTGGRQNLQNYVEKVRPPSSSELLQAEQRLKEAIIEIRQLIHLLRPAELFEYGLTAALRQYVRELNETPGSECKPNFRLEGSEAPRLDNAVETAIFRTVQEAITNACQHARNAPLEVLVRVKSLRNRAFNIQIEVRDKGKGFDMASVYSGDPVRHSGLLIMQERMNLIGGTCQIETAPGKGTTVTLTYETQPG